MLSINSRVVLVQYSSSFDGYRPPGTSIEAIETALFRLPASDASFLS